jgi:hypothetical protein
MSRVRDMLQRLEGKGNPLAQDEIKDILEKLKRLGPEGIKQVLQQVPGAAQTLSGACAGCG